MSQAEWMLEPGLIYLNHGSFGACPWALMNKQREYQEFLESHPVRGFLSEIPKRMEKVQQAMAAFVGCDSQDLVFVVNATTAVNCVIRSLEWKPGEQVILTNHTYNACANVLHYVAERYGVEVVVADVPFPITDKQQALDAILACVTPQTRLAMIDHITSSTGMVLPIQSIVDALKEKGVDTLVDGAHAPGMLPLHLDQMGAAYYVGNCHKWMCTPKGVAILHVRRDKQDAIRPVVISHGANEPLRGRSRFQIEFSWLGTDDPTARLCLLDSIAWGEKVIDGGWNALMKRNRDLVLRARRLLCDTLGVDPPTPDDMVGMLATLPLPPAAPRQEVSAFDIDPLQAALLKEYNIEVPVFMWPKHPQRWLRISAQLYNQFEDYERLAKGLTTLLPRERAGASPFEPEIECS